KTSFGHSVFKMAAINVNALAVTNSKPLIFNDLSIGQLMSLVLTTYNLSDWDTFSVLSKLPQTQPGVHTDSSQLLRPIQTIESFLELLNNLPENQQLLLAAVQAEYFIADALEAGKAIADAALEWQKLTIELLNIQRQHRNRVQIFNLHQALAAPDKIGRAHV